MTTLMIQKEVFDKIAGWTEIQQDFGIPVILGEPAIQEIDGVEWCVFDDSAIIEDQALALVEATNGI